MIYDESELEFSSNNQYVLRELKDMLMLQQHYISLLLQQYVTCHAFIARLIMVKAVHI